MGGGFVYYPPPPPAIVILNSDEIKKIIGSTLEMDEAINQCIRSLLKGYLSGTSIHCVKAKEWSSSESKLTLQVLDDYRKTCIDKSYPIGETDAFKNMYIRLGIWPSITPALEARIRGVFNEHFAAGTSLWRRFRLPRWGAASGEAGVSLLREKL